MPDVQILAPGVKAAPLTYELADTTRFLVKAAGATFDGAGAAGSFLPAIVITPPSGVPLPPYVTDTAVAAGSSAEVSFAPFLSNAGASVSPLGPVGTTLDYVEAPAGLFTINATTPAGADLWIQGNAIAFDGVSTAKIEVWVALGTTDRDLVLELFMDGIDQGRIGQLSPSSYAYAGSFIGVGHVKPSAGNHTLSIRAWKTVVGAVGTLLNPAPFPAVAFQPSFYEVTVSSPIA